MTKILSFSVLIILLCFTKIVMAEGSINNSGLADEDIRLEIKICTQPITNDTIDKLEQKVNANPNAWQVHFLLSVLYSKLKIGARANDELKKFTDLCPKDAKVYTWLVNSLVNLKEIDIASQLLGQAAMLFPENFMENNLLNKKNIPDNRSLSGVSLALAKVAFRKGNYYKAIELARLANNGENYFAYFQEGLALMNLGQYKQAIQPLSMAYHNIKEVPSAQMYAKALLWIGNYKQALEPTLFALANDETILTKNYSQMLDLLLSKVSKSDSYAIILNFTNNNQIKNPIFYFVLAQCLDKNGMNDLAITEYNKLLAIEPQNYDAWYNLASDYEKYQRNYDKALGCYKRAYELNPYSKAYDNLIRLQERLNDQKSDISWYIKDFLINIFAPNL